MDKTSSMYLYVKLNWDANRFLPAESKDCMNSASYEYRNMSARRGAQFVPIGMPTICWKSFPNGRSWRQKMFNSFTNNNLQRKGKQSKEIHMMLTIFKKWKKKHELKDASKTWLHSVCWRKGPSIRMSIAIYMMWRTWFTDATFRLTATVE